MKSIMILLLVFTSILGTAQVSEKELDQVEFQNFTTDDGVVLHSFSMDGKLIGPSHSMYPDGLLSYTNFGDEGLAQGFQMVEAPSTGVQVLQMMKDNMKHGNAFKLVGSELAYAQSYKKDKIHKVKEIDYTSKASNRANCIGNCINGFGLLAANSEQMLMGYWWGESPQTPVIHTFPSGDEYKGEMKKWDREGFGKYKWPSGEYYVGMWKNNKKHGLGIWFNADGKIKRQGFFKKDKHVKSL